MPQRAPDQQAKRHKQQAEHIRSVAATHTSSASASEQIASAKALVHQGAITQAEIDQLKAKALS